jgi:hypothetical protein
METAPAEVTRLRRNSSTRCGASREGTAVIKSVPMNDRQQAHIDYFLERIEYWRGAERDETTARMLAARDADHAHPLRSEEEGSEVFDYLRRLEQGQLSSKELR